MASAFSSRTNDHEFLIGSTTRALELMRDSDEKAMYQVSTEVPEYMNPLTFTQTNWIGGHHQRDYLNPLKYFEGQSIDTTQDGRIILGPKVHSVSPSAGVMFEYHNSGGDASAVPDSTQAMAQTFTPSVAHTITKVNLQLGRAVTVPVTITISIKATDSNGHPTGSALCSGTTEAVGLPTYGSEIWREVSLGAGTALTADTQYAIVMTLSNDSASWKYDNTDPTYTGGCYLFSADGGSTWTANSGRDLMFEEYGNSFEATPLYYTWFPAISQWMCATTERVFWYDNINMVEKKAFLGETITGLAVVADILYVCLGASTKYYYSTDGVTFTQTDLSDGYANKIIAAPNPAGTATVLWKFKTPNEISNTTDGRTAGDGGVAWSSPAYIGDTSYNITNLFLSNDRLMVGKEDNLYYYDSNGGVHPIMNDLGSNISADNFKYATEWQGNIYFSLASRIREIAGNTLDSIGPTQEAVDIGRIGTCMGIVGDKDYLHVAMRETLSRFPYTFPFSFTTSSDIVVHIYKGKEDWTRGELTWNWCPWGYIGSNDCKTLAIHQHSDTDRRLWYGYGNYAGYSFLSDSPTVGGSPSTFASSGWLRMSYLYGTDPYWDKLFQSVVTQTTGCTANLTVTPKYRKDTDTSATSLTAAITTNGTVKTNLTSALNCNRIQFELHLATNDDTSTPEVLFFQARGIEKPETVRVHEATYKAVSKPSITTLTMRDFIRDGKTSTSLIKFADLRYGQTTSGTSSSDYVWVVFEPGYPREVEVVHEKGRKPELGIMVRMREVSFTIS